MARIVIREQDLTGNRVNQDFTDIAFVPGFVKYPKVDYTSPQLCYNEEEFIDRFGNEPAVAYSRFVYNVKYDNQDVLNPDTGNTAFYLDSDEVESVSDCAYHYARELLSRGLPLYYCPMNEKIYTDQSDETGCGCGLTTGESVWTGELKAYDGTQALASGTTPTISKNSSVAKVTILHKGSTDPTNVSTQGASEKYFVGTTPSITIKKGPKAQTVPYNSTITLNAQVEGTAIESFSYKWYLVPNPSSNSTNDANDDTNTNADTTPDDTTGGVTDNIAGASPSEDYPVSGKVLIGTSQVCKISSLKYGDLTKDRNLYVQVEVTGVKTNAQSIDTITITSAGDTQPLSMSQVLNIAKAKAIRLANEVTQNTFAAEMLSFFSNSENTELIKDRGLYNFKYMTTGGYPLFEAATLKSDGTSQPYDGTGDRPDWKTALVKLLEVCGQKTVDDSKDYIDESGSTQRQGRGDCILLIDHMNDRCQDTMELYNHVREYFEDPANVNDDTLEFAAMFTPWCNYGMTYTSKNIDVDLPASFAYLSCLADSIQSYDNWNAIAGVTRGTVKNINEILLRNPLTNTKANKCQADPETAEKGRVSINCITEIKPYGQVIWGNRTLQKADGYKHVTAMGFLNLRNEISDIKKLVYRAARRWMFEQNTSVLWVNFKSTITPLLERMVNGYGLSRYEIRKGVKTAKHKLYAEIRVWPIYAVEYIDVTIQILDEDTIVTEE